MRRLISVLFFLITAAECYSQDSSVYKIARDFFKNDQFSDAAFWFGKSIGQGYKTADSYRYIGLCELMLGNMDSARSNLFRSYKLDTSDIRIPFQIGNFYLWNKMHDSAIIWINKAISIYDGDGDYFDHRAMAYIEKGLFDKAIQDENKAISINAQNGRYYNNRGMARLKQKKIQEALGDFNMALNIDSSLENSVTTYINASLCNYELHNYQKALYNCRKVLDAYPDDTYALVVRGQVYYALKKTADACSDFKRLYELNAAMGKEYIEKYCR
ncbi:MAG: tetratricopeptide repeat protein [Chitinophagaceae bacterium]